MRAFTTEVTIAMTEDPRIFSPQVCRIRVLDEAAGPYLAIEGIDAEPDDEGHGAHCFYLQSDAEIDEFAAICKRVLKEAE